MGKSRTNVDRTKTLALIDVGILSSLTYVRDRQRVLRAFCAVRVSGRARDEQWGK